MKLSPDRLWEEVVPPCETNEVEVSGKKVIYIPKESGWTIARVCFSTDKKKMIVVIEKGNENTRSTMEGD